MATKKWKYYDIELSGPLKKNELVEKIRQQLDQEMPTDVVEHLSAICIRVEGVKEIPPDVPGRSRIRHK